MLTIDIVFSVFLGLLIFVIVGSFFFSIERMEKGAMSPLLRDGDKVLVNRGNKNLRRFDVVIFKNGNSKEIRRIIGFSGESVKYNEDVLQVDDDTIDEKFIFDKLQDYGSMGKIFTQSAQAENGFVVGNIPEGYLLLLGDNRPNSTDSRHYGMVRVDRIIGKVIYKLSPIEKIK